MLAARPQAPEPAALPEPAPPLVESPAASAPEAELAAQPMFAADSEPVAPAAPATETGPICSACGRANPAGRVFCVLCGERLPAAGTTAAGELPPPPTPGPARETPRIRPMLPGAGTAPKPRPLVQPARPAVEPIVPPGIATPIAGVRCSIDDDATGCPAPAPAPVQPPAARPVSSPSSRPPQRPVPLLPTARPPWRPPPRPRRRTSPRTPTEAVRPGPSARGRLARSRETPAPNPGELVCGNCGIGNDPTRKFCRRCGQSLAAAVVAVAPRPAWYRRLLGGGRRRRVAAAGERPTSMRKDGRTGGGISLGRLVAAGLQILVIAAVVGAVAGYAIIPSWRDAVNGFVGSIADVVMPPADPVSTAGKASGPGAKSHPAQSAFDGTTAYWAAPFAEGKPPTIQASFTPVADISKVLVTAGAPARTSRASLGRGPSPSSSWQRRLGPRHQGRRAEGRG